MPSGGARSRSGPPKNPNALRRDRDRDEWVTLPAEGRAGLPPAWPLPEPSFRELELWDDAWAMPQAVMWGAQRQFVEVAIYVRHLASVEGVDRPAADLVVLLRMQDNLGLNMPGLARNKWRIGVAEVEQERRPSAAPSRRLKVVAADAVEGSELSG